MPRVYGAARTVDSIDCAAALFFLRFLGDSLAKPLKKTGFWYTIISNIFVKKRFLYKPKEKKVRRTWRFTLKNHQEHLTNTF